MKAILSKISPTARGLTLSALAAAALGLSGCTDGVGYAYETGYYRPARVYYDDGYYPGYYGGAYYYGDSYRYSRPGVVVYPRTGARPANPRWNSRRARSFAPRSAPTAPRMAPPSAPKVAPAPPAPPILPNRR